MKGPCPVAWVQAKYETLMVLQRELEESYLKFLPSCNHQKDIFQYQSPAEKEGHILLAVLLSLHFQKQINRPQRIRKAQPEPFRLDLCSTNTCSSGIPPNPVRFSHPQARVFSVNALVNGKKNCKKWMISSIILLGNCKYNKPGNERLTQQQCVPRISG